MKLLKLLIIFPLALLGVALGFLVEAVGIGFAYGKDIVETFGDELSKEMEARRK